MCEWRHIDHFKMKHSRKKKTRSGVAALAQVYLAVLNVCRRGDCGPARSINSSVVWLVWSQWVVVTSSSLTNHRAQSSSVENSWSSVGVWIELWSVVSWLTPQQQTQWILTCRDSPVLCAESAVWSVSHAFVLFLTETVAGHRSGDRCLSTLCGINKVYCYHGSIILVCCSAPLWSSELTEVKAASSPLTLTSHQNKLTKCQRGNILTHKQKNTTVHRLNFITSSDTLYSDCLSQHVCDHDETINSEHLTSEVKADVCHEHVTVRWERETKTHFFILIIYRT